MRNKNIFILAGITLALIIFAFFLEKKENSEADKKFQRLQIKSDQIQQVVIDRDFEGHSEIIDLYKDTSGWHFRNIKTDVDVEYINDLIQKIEDLDFLEVQADKDKSKDQFRFDKPAAQILLIDNLGIKKNLILSSRKNFEGHVYCKLNENDKIYTTDFDISGKVLSKIIYFQQKHIFSYQFEAIHKIKIKSLNKSFEIIPPFEKNKILELITKLRNLTVQKYLENDKIKIMSPIVTLEIFTIDNVWTMKMSLNESDKKLYASINNNDVQIQNVEFDTSYWAYFANLNQTQFSRDKNDKN